MDGPETPAAAATVALAKGDFAHGYVRSAQPSGKGAGVFVSLSSSQTARVELRMLSDDFVDDPVAAFPEGKHVSGRVIAADAGRVQLSLKTVQGGAGAWKTLASLEVGQVLPVTLCLLTSCCTPGSFAIVHRLPHMTGGMAVGSPES